MITSGKGDRPMHGIVLFMNTISQSRLYLQMQPALWRQPGNAIPAPPPPLVVALECAFPIRVFSKLPSFCLTPITSSMTDGHNICTRIWHLSKYVDGKAAAANPYWDFEIPSPPPSVRDRLSARSIGQDDVTRNAFLVTSSHLISSQT